jgi:hypothetical protein
MAASKSDVFDMVKEYGVTNNRPIPKRDVVAKYGDDGLTHLKALVADGQLGCRRGRNGGYFFKSEDAAPIVNDAPIEADNGPSSDEDVEDESNSLAEQFAALNARIAAAEAAEAAEAEAESEQVPF